MPNNTALGRCLSPPEIRAIGGDHAFSNYVYRNRFAIRVIIVIGNWEMALVFIEVSPLTATQELTPEVVVVPLHGLVQIRSGHALANALCRGVVDELDCGCL